MVSRFMETAANRDYSKEWQSPGSFPWIFQRPKAPIEGRPVSVRDKVCKRRTALLDACIFL